MLFQQLKFIYLFQIFLYIINRPGLAMKRVGGVSVHTFFCNFPPQKKTLFSHLNPNIIQVITYLTLQISPMSLPLLFCCPQCFAQICSTILQHMLHDNGYNYIPFGVALAQICIGYRGPIRGIWQIPCLLSLHSDHWRKFILIAWMRSSGDQ